MECLNPILDSNCSLVYCYFRPGKASVSKTGWTNWVSITHMGGVDGTLSPWWQEVLPQPVLAGAPWFSWSLNRKWDQRSISPCFSLPPWLVPPTPIFLQINKLSVFHSRRELLYRGQIFRIPQVEFQEDNTCLALRSHQPFSLLSLH